MNFKASEIATIIKKEIEQYQSKLDVAEVGKVLEVGDGVARIYGLGKAQAGEMLEFTESGAMGVVLNLEENSIGSVVLGGYLDVKEGEEVRATGRLMSVPVGK
ncbi:MAG: F0F1 ATP synthase subunit alpha, partial [Phycisphaerales bacterium]|nr:F0F1 ATP synthase subunit alpha [Phycisphaerales bacterium]